MGCQSKKLIERELKLLTHLLIYPHSYSGCCKLHSWDGNRLEGINSSFAHEESTMNLLVFVYHLQVEDSAITTLT